MRRDALRYKMLIEKEIDSIVKDRAIINSFKQAEDPRTHVYKYYDNKLKSYNNRLAYLKKKWRALDGVFYRD